ncbi:MAG: M15 family metallopeptidase [Terrisporobacter sp.]
MKKMIKRVIILMIIGGGFIYMFDCIKADSETVQGKVYKQNSNTDLMLVNKNHRVDNEYKPEKLIVPDIKFNDESNLEEKHVSDKIVKPLENLVNNAKKEGIILIGNSGYRSYNSQRKTYNNRVKSQGKEIADEYVAKPGFSEHQTGLCIDITNESKYFVKGTKEADWLAENCYKYGFIIRYPEGKDTITGIAHEPWHIRYVGKKVAKEIYDKDITLEEYLNV